MGMFALHLLLCFIGFVAGRASYLIGAGMADVTGPVAEINMMGYAEFTQQSSGIHLRTYSRAFIIADRDGTNKVAFVSVDVGMISQLVKMEVIAALKNIFDDEYDDSNVMLSGTHTHSGPGAYHQYFLFEITSLGLYEPSLDALVSGIVKSIERAHNKMAPGNIYMNEGELMESSINRSPIAYENNPEEERARYEHNVDKTMVLLRLTDVDDHGIGMINWFAVHPTSMNKTNTLVSSDNKGYASILFEKDMNPENFPGEGDFVAAFAQSNQGDVSPNIQGAKCQDTGEPCDQLTSTCDGRVENCYALGPGRDGDMFDSTRIIATRQYNKAKELYEGARVRLRGPVDFRLKYVNMTRLDVPINDTHTGRTCKPAMGYSFAAGTTDGPGLANFKQGDLHGTNQWNVFRNFITQPSAELIECHAPKPILLPTGEIPFPYPWQAEIVDYQILRIGQLFILGVPGEFSTMAGRRLRESVYETLVDNGLPDDTKVVIAGLANSYTNYVVTYEEYQVALAVSDFNFLFHDNLFECGIWFQVLAPINNGLPDDTKVVIAGLANSYTNYVVTYEEYQIQRYEGASTIYGPHTLAASINVLSQMAAEMAQGRPVDKGVPPPNLKEDQWKFNLPVIYDKPHLGAQFGDVLQDADPTYTQGDTVQVSFVAGNPRNSDQSTTEFMRVEKKDSDGQWHTVYKDSDWSTKFSWTRHHFMSFLSTAWVTWDIPANQQAGTYRIVHEGNYKKMGTGYPIVPYTGITTPFQIPRRARPARSLNY